MRQVRFYPTDIGLLQIVIQHSNERNRWIIGICPWLTGQWGEATIRGIMAERPKPESVLDAGTRGGWGYAWIHVSVGNTGTRVLTVYSLPPRDRLQTTWMGTGYCKRQSSLCCYDLLRLSPCCSVICPILDISPLDVDMEGADLWRYCTCADESEMTVTFLWRFFLTCRVVYGGATLSKFRLPFMENVILLFKDCENNYFASIKPFFRFRGFS